MLFPNLRQKSILALLLSYFCLSSVAFAKPPSSSPQDRCEGLSDYMISSDGQCVNLTYVNGGRPKLLPGYELKISKFEQALARLGVPIMYTPCEEIKPGLVLLGSYNSATNRMTICEATQTLSQRQIYETLVHESWHTVQDCIAGLDNPNILALSQTRPGFRQEVLGGISIEDFATMAVGYSQEQQLTESEARFMENKPALVLDALRRCKPY